MIVLQLYGIGYRVFEHISMRIKEDADIEESELDEAEPEPPFPS